MAVEGETEGFNRRLEKQIKKLKLMFNDLCDRMKPVMCRIQRYNIAPDLSWSSPQIIAVKIICLRGDTHLRSELSVLCW